MKTAYISFNVVPDDKNFYHDSYIKNKRIVFEDGKLFEAIQEYTLKHAHEGINRFDIKNPKNIYIGDGELVGFIFRYTAEYDKGDYTGFVKKHGDIWVNIDIPNLPNELKKYKKVDD